MSTHDTSARALFRHLYRLAHEQPRHPAIPGLRYAVGTLAGRALREAHQAGDLDAMGRAQRTLDALDRVPTSDDLVEAYEAQLQAAVDADREAFAERIRAWDAQQVAEGAQEGP